MRYMLLVQLGITRHHMITYAYFGEHDLKSNHSIVGFSRDI